MPLETEKEEEKDREYDVDDDEEIYVTNDDVNKEFKE